MKLPQSFLPILLFILSLSWGYGQCINSNPTLFWKDADRDGWGSGNFSTNDMVMFQILSFENKN